MTSIKQLKIWMTSMSFASLWLNLRVRHSMPKRLSIILTEALNSATSYLKHSKCVSKFWTNSCTAKNLILTRQRKWSKRSQMLWKDRVRATKISQSSKENSLQLTSQLSIKILYSSKFPKSKPSFRNRKSYLTRLAWSKWAVSQIRVILWTSKIGMRHSKKNFSLRSKKALIRRRNRAMRS